MRAVIARSVATKQSRERRASRTPVFRRAMAPRDDGFIRMQDALARQQNRKRQRMQPLVKRGVDGRVPAAKQVEPARFRQLRPSAPCPLRLSMRRVARHHDCELPVSRSPHIAEGPIRAIALDDKRLIIAVGEEFRLLAPKGKEQGGCRQFRPAVLPFVHQRREQRRALVRSFETSGEVRDRRLTLTAKSTGRRLSGSTRLRSHSSQP